MERKSDSTIMNKVNTNSKPSDLKITDIRFTDISGAPFECSLIKIYTNQDIVGYGEVRDFGSKVYAQMLKSRILHENPCNVERIFKRIKQFGGQARQGGGVSGIELALWDLAGKAYGVPVYQLLGGKYRDKIRIYCDTDVYGKNTGKEMGKALKKRMEKGFQYLKMDVGIDILLEEDGTLNGPKDILDEMRKYPDMPKFNREGTDRDSRLLQKHIYNLYNIAHPFTGIQITEKGLDFLENYVSEVRDIVGYDIPIAVDHFGHIGVDNCIRLLRRIEKYNIAWAEDMVPWFYTDQYVRLNNSSTIPVCTGEDIYLKENFKPLIEQGGVSVIHPDILTAGGILETKRIGDMAEEFGVAMAIHNAESPIAFLAAVHTAAATENFIALEHHSADIDWWDDLVDGPDKPIVNRGYVDVPDRPGLGIDSLNDEVISKHINPRVPGLWESTDNWDHEWSHDRTWS